MIYYIVYCKPFSIKILIVLRTHVKYSTHLTVNDLFVKLNYSKTIIFFNLQCNINYIIF